ncbi:hypothetical protein COHA_007030 [Chlorella ohadii]|uniref:Uncharacterized protein n=1 Tax=Chlorella ohadii TaxID=2649997 RepID=A0AAD5DKB2_9CHLO|nr:hypothetical protein COHA_007030 [Chlorella ohadii]
MAGDEEQVEQAVNFKQEIAVRSLFSSLPLHELLAFLRMRDAKGCSRVHTAAAAGDSAMLASLLAASPDQLQLGDSMGRPPLAVAVAHWRPEAVALLLRQLWGAGWAARAEAAKQALPYVLSQPPPGGEQPARQAALAAVVDALRTAEAVHPPRVLGVAQRLLLAGARLDEQCAAASLYGIPGLRGATAVGYLCSVAMEVSGGAQLAALALVDMLLQAGASPSARNQAGNGPLHIAAGALYSVCHGFPAAAPAATASFTALLHRLLTAGADVGEENTAGYTPLGKLLCCGSLVSLSQAVLDGVRALLAVGSTLAAAGGGRAWKAVLSAALTATGETEPWYAGTGAAEQRQLCDELLRTLLDPNALDAGQATEAAQLIEATLDEDEEDDAELLTDEEEDEAVQEAGAAERERKRRRWCARRLGTRLELAAACQSALRQSVKLHDPLLTRRLLAAGAAPGGGPGQALMEELLDEWGLLSHMVSLQQEERRPVLCWLFDTAEALLGAGTQPLPDMYYFEVAASWSFPWLGLMESVLAGRRWSPTGHQDYPAPFRAAARTLLLINGTRGFGCAPRQPRRSPRRPAQPSTAGRSMSLPAEVLQHILALAASPLSLWLKMMPEADF